MKSKSLLLTAVATLCIAIVGFAQNVPSYVPTNGLVGWWPFNGNANDESGNGNNGNVIGPTLNFDRFGNANTSYSFDGINDFIDLGATSSLNSLQLNYTISYWIKKTDSENGMVIASFAEGFAGAGWRYHSAVRGDSIDSRFMRSDNINWAINFTNQGSIIINEWINICNVRNGVNFSTYINGVLNSNSIVQNVAINNAPQNTLATTKIGVNWPSALGEYFGGEIDDIAIYNRALTQQEITNLYNASTTLPLPCPTIPSNLQTGLVGYWPFCGNANDESGNGNNGTVNGATLTTDRFGNAGKSYSFDGTSDYISVPNSSSLSSGLNSITMSAWININEWYNVNNSGWFPIISKSDLTNTYGLYRLGIGYQPNLNSETIYSNLNTENGDAERNNIIQTGQWRHITVTINSTNHIARVYINGALIKDSATTLWQSSPPSPSLPLIIGMDRPGIVEYANGKIDDICIWNRALDSTEVTQLYQTQSTASSNGNVGVNVVVPQRSLHVKDVMRMEPRSAAPENPVKGDIYFDGVLNKLRVYDGTAWQNCW